MFSIQELHEVLAEGFLIGSESVLGDELIDTFQHYLTLAAPIAEMLYLHKLPPTVEDRKSIEKVKNALVRYGYDFSEINRAVKEYFESAGGLEEEN